MQRKTRLGHTGNSIARTFDSRKRKMTDKFINDQIAFVWSIYLHLLKKGSIKLSKKEHGHHLYQLAGSLYSIKLFECITDRLAKKLKGGLRLPKK